jgi:hypothetical protein
MASSSSSIGSWEARNVLARESLAGQAKRNSYLSEQVSSEPLGVARAFAAARAAFKFNFDERKFMLPVTSADMETT